MSAPVAPPPVAPRGVTPPRVPSPADTSSPDLPTPVERPTAMAFKVPTVDLPTPARPSSAGGFRTPEPPPFSPSSSSGSAPLVADFGNDAGMISVADLDLPTPVELDLPTPAGVVDLPTPIGLDLPTPAGAGLLQPATGLLTPADQAVQPAHNLPGVAEQGVQPAGRRAPQPRDLAEAASASSTDAGERAFDPVGARRSPAPRAIEHGGNRRPLILGLAGLALIGAVGGGMYAIGVFDPPIDDIPVATGRRKPSDGKNGDTTQPATPSATASERNAAVLALLARDTPEGYIEAITVAEQAGDPVGQAEAALLLHLRYGPDPARKAQAATWLEPYAKQADPFVVRVLGLVALGSGALAQADTMLVGDDSRLRLYRGWLRLRQGKANDAASEADAMRAIKPDDVGALVLQHAARAQLDPIAELAKLEASIDAHRGHPGLLAVGVRAATASGELRRARAWLEQIGEQAGTSKGWAASKLRLRADIEVAAGLLPTAVRLLDEAIALDPEDRELALARVRVLLDAGRIADAESTMRKLLETKPDDVDALTMRAEIRVAAGKGDEALAELDAIEKVAPGRARTSYLLGLVYSARAQTEQGRTAFAAAIQRDPTLLEAQIAEARVLAEGAKIGEAIALLDTARKQAADRSNERDEATVLRNKATLLVKAGQNAAAAAALDDAIAANGRDNAAQLARGLMRLEQGDAAGARADLFAVYERAGAIAGLTAPLARILVREGALDELEKLVGDQLDDAETLPELLLVGARLRLAQGKHDEAKALLQRVFETLPNDWEANLLLAQAMLDSGDRVGALAQIDRSTPAVPTAEKHLLRGKILEHNGKHDEARPEYLKALQIDAADHEARFLYGRLLAYSGESRAAADELGKVVAAAPDRFPDAWLNLGRAQRELGEQSNALASLTKAVALDENLFEAHYIIGRIRYEENDMAKAIAALEKATDERAKDTKPYIDAFLFLGRAQAKAGQNKAAAASFRKFLEIAPADHSGRADAERQVKALR